MRTLIMSLSNWPRRKNGEYIFQSTEEALFFANLALGKSDVIDILNRGWSLARVSMNNERTRGTPNLQRMFDLSVKSQLFRECIEEINRIRKELPKDDKTKHFLEG